MYMKSLSAVKSVFIICILLSSCTHTEVETADGDAALLSAPRAIASPANDDEFFFNYRLSSFAPATEPFIKETFGETTVFEDIAFWEYASYTSCAVGFGTNLPTVSIVEYGETAAYGHTTVQSESYFYRHLHYIRGLESGKTYHYRIVAQDYDGVTISSADRAFTAKQPDADVIRIPDDMEGDPPFFLTRSDAEYVLTQDLTAPALAINIKADNVKLDLDGHTIVYDDAPFAGEWPEYNYNDDATAGIRAGLWNKINFKILNGTVRQGRNGGKGHVPIFLFHMGHTYNEIAGITVDYYGGNMGGMVTSNGHVHHNVLYDRGTTVDDRHSGVRAIATAAGVAHPDNNFSFNSLRRFRHFGIGSTSGIVCGNEPYSDSFDTNSFALAAGDNVEVSGNRIFGMGYLPIGIVWGSDLHVKENFIYLRGFAPSVRSEEYGRKSAIAGMRLTDGNMKNLLYEDNVVVLKPEDGCTQARGIWGFNAVNNKNIVYRRNTV